MSLGDDIRRTGRAAGMDDSDPADVLGAYNTAIARATDAILKTDPERAGREIAKAGAAHLSRVALAAAGGAMAVALGTGIGIGWGLRAAVAPEPVVATNLGPQPQAVVDLIRMNDLAARIAEAQPLYPREGGEARWLPVWTKLPTPPQKR